MPETTPSRTAGPSSPAGAVRVKICGITRPEDARAAVGAGASYVGAVLSAGFARSLDAARAAELLTDLPAEGGAELVAVLVDESPARAVALARAAGARVLQLHGGEGPAELRSLRAEGPWRLWKAVRVGTAEEVLEALETFGGLADGLLLEGHHAGRGGGAGAAFPWEAVARLRERFPEGVVLIAAGGLTPLNVREAVLALRPDVVDTSSGVEVSPGVKDPAKVIAFAREAMGGAADGGDRQGRGAALLREVAR